MKRTVILIIVMAVVLVCLAVFLIGRHGQTDKVAMGEMLPVTQLPDQRARQIAVEMRLWLDKDMTPEQLRTLSDTGRVVFVWKDLKISNPKRAALIDSYTEQMREDLAQAYIRAHRPLPVPARFATHHDPDTVEFERLQNTAYRVAIRSKEGLAACYVEISR